MSLTRKEQLENLKKSPGASTRYWDQWYDLLKGLPYRIKTSVPLATWQGEGGSLTGDIDLFDLPAGGEILSAFIDVTEGFGVTGLTAGDLSMGTAASVTGLQTSQGATGAALLTAMGGDLRVNRAVYDMSAATTVVAQLIIAGVTCSQLTAGSADFYVTYVEHID
jgi:hypothetical protein